VKLPTDIVNLISIKIKLPTHVVNLSFVDKKLPSPVVKLLTTGNKKLLSYVLKFLIITIVKFDDFAYKCNEVASSCCEIVYHCSDIACRCSEVAYHCC
jgi:hypothetical protein